MLTNCKWGGGVLSNCNTPYHKKKSFIRDKAFSSGFTLIELLAVIIILAVISLIAIPMIMNVIESSRKGSYTESLRNLIKAVEYYEAREEMEGNALDFENGLDVKSPNIEMKNRDFISGNIVKNEDGELYLDMVSNGAYCGNGTIDKLNVIKGTCDELDLTVPSDIIITANKITSNSITVAVNVTVGHSGVKYYEYSVDGGVTYQKVEQNSYTFKDLTKNTDYSIRVKVTSGNHLTGESDIKTVKTLDIEMPSYSMMPNTTEWVQKRMVTIMYPERGEGYIYDYSLDKGKTWVVLESGNRKELEFVENGTILARIQDGTNVITGETFVVSNVDSEVPVISGVTGNSEVWVQRVTLNIDAKDNISGLHEAPYSFDDGVTWQSENTKVFTSNQTVKIKVRDKALNEIGINVTISKVDSGTPTAPTITGGSTTIAASRTISVSKASTSTSSIKLYQYYISTSSTGQIGGSWINLVSGVTNVSITTSGTRYIYFRAVNNAGKAGTISNAQVTVIGASIDSIMTDDKAGTNGSINTDARGNKRFAGSNPNNYVCFGKVGDTCDAEHLYRIIGVIDGQPKLIKNSHYSTGIEWDTSNSNNWARPATLKTELNGNAFYGNTSYIDAVHKSYIVNATWYIGGTAYASGANYLSSFETDERNSKTTGYIGLLSVTDFGYASNSVNCNKNSTDLNSKDNACMSNNWLFDINVAQWTITPRLDYSYNVWSVDGYGSVLNRGANGKREIYPSLFLDPTVRIKGGEGSISKPYILIK